MVANNKKNLVIVESPGKIKTISKVLGKDYVVKASVGHVRDLTKSKKTDAKDAIVLGVARDFTPTYTNLPKSKKILDDLKKTAQQAKAVYLCPDPDREGEAIAWHLKEALDLEDEQTYRVTFDEITSRGIREAFKSPRRIDMNLVNAQQARRVLDRIVGYKLSPLLWEKIARGLSAGRVQSVALRLIVEREREIEAFNAEEYWTIGASFGFAGKSFEGELRALDGQQVVSSAQDLEKFKKQDASLGASGVLRTLIKNEAEAKALAELLGKAPYQVVSYETREVQDRPYPPFATSQLQQSAANRLGYDARRTMRIAQQLYEGIALGEEGPTALITYMRTDSFRVAQEAVADVRGLIESAYGPEYVPEKPNAYSSRKGAQEAHECIRPTNINAAHAPDAIRKLLSDEQYKLYKLIWERFVASQVKPAVFDATSCDIAAQGAKFRNATFRATGRVMKFAGWLAVYGGKASDSHLDVAQSDREKGDEASESDADEPVEGSDSKAAKKKAKPKKRSEQVLPKMAMGDAPDLKELTPVQHFTQPPPRYTDASLVKMLEREGIGRPSTYATIISTLQDRGYARKTGAGGRGSFMATALGIAVSDRLVDHFDHSIMNLGFTREMESELDKIEEAQLDWRKVLKDFYGPFTGDLDTAAASIKSTKGQGEKTDVKCPECGAFMEKLLNRYGIYLRCTKAPECKGTLRLDDKGNIAKKNEPQATGLTCDLCHAPVMRSVGRFGAYFHCAQYPEKKCAFTMKSNKDGMPVRKFKALDTDRKCEKCKSPLVVRITWRGKNRRPFLSCSNFPKCRAAVDLPEDLKELGEQAMAQWRVMDAQNRKDQETYQAFLAQQTQAAASEEAEVEAEEAVTRA